MISKTILSVIVMMIAVTMAVPAFAETYELNMDVGAKSHQRTIAITGEIIPHPHAPASQGIWVIQSAVFENPQNEQVRDDWTVSETEIRTQETDSQGNNVVKFVMSLFDENGFVAKQFLVDFRNWNSTTNSSDEFSRAIYTTYYGQFSNMGEDGYEVPVHTASLTIRG